MDKFIKQITNKTKPLLKKWITLQIWALSQKYLLEEDNLFLK